MSFTRFHDDPARIAKQLDEMTYTFRYQLDTPGPGVQLPFIEDPQFRLQRWGANMWSESTNLESDLMGLGRPLNHDYDRSYKDLDTKRGYQISFPTMSGAVTDESRATHPAWMYRDLQQHRWETPFLNPQASVHTERMASVNSRIVSKDEYVCRLPDPRLL